MVWLLPNSTFIVRQFWIAFDGKTVLSTRNALGWAAPETGGGLRPSLSLAVAAADWVGLPYLEITPPSNFHHLRDKTRTPRPGTRSH